MAKKKLQTNYKLVLDQPIKDLNFNEGQIDGVPKNPRFIRDERYEDLLKSLKDNPEMLELREVIAYDNDGELIVILGNQRLRGERELGKKFIPTKILPSGTDKRKLRAYVNKDNVGFGEFDWDLLANEWDIEELTEDGMELPADLFADDEAQDDDYEAPDDIETELIEGDLIEFKTDDLTHRLICGDSRHADVIEKLMENREPYLMITDPPYGVEYDANWRNEAERSDGTKVGAKAVKKVDNDEIIDWSEVWALSPSRVAYVWHAGKYSGTVQIGLEKCNFEIRSQIIWNKSVSVISRGHYHWKHEPCLYAVKKGNAGNWAGDRKQNTVWDIDKPRSSDSGHSTQKPVECMARAIKNHDGDVFDPFVGSGTTIVAAHQLNRNCYAIDLDPKNCQICIDRMVKLDPQIQVFVNGKDKTKDFV